MPYSGIVYTLWAVCLAAVVSAWLVKGRKDPHSAAWAVLGAVFMLLVCISSSVTAMRLSESIQCGEKLGDIRAAVELYAADDTQGEYPPSLEYLMPSYFLEIPECSGGGGSYEYAVISKDKPGCGYTVMCRRHRSR